MTDCQRETRPMQTLLSNVVSTGVATLCCWFVGSSLWIYPHSLSYFNEFVGGPLNGAEHLLGSNLDWGQDLRYVQQWASKGGFTSARIAAICLYSPEDLGIMRDGLHCEDAKGVSVEWGRSYAFFLSKNTLHGDPFFTVDSCDREGVEGRVAEFVRRTCVRHVGYSMEMHWCNTQDGGPRAASGTRKAKGGEAPVYEKPGCFIEKVAIFIEKVAIVSAAFCPGCSHLRSVRHTQEREVARQA